jgi:hypothetical protein
MAPPLQARSPRSSCGDPRGDKGAVSARTSGEAQLRRTLASLRTSGQDLRALRQSLPTPLPHPTHLPTSTRLARCCHALVVAARACAAAAAWQQQLPRRRCAFRPFRCVCTHRPHGRGSVTSGAVSPIQPSSQAVKQGLKNSICRGCRGPSKGPRWTAHGVRKFAGGVGLRPRGYPCQGARRAQLRPARGGQAATG